jgi:hypothetical protein
MATTDPTAPDARRFSTRLQRRLSIGVPAGVLIAIMAIRCCLADEETDEDTPVPVQEAAPDAALAQARAEYERTIKQLSVTVSRKQLDTFVRQKIAIVDRVCRLSGDQKQKLHLAGRGDIKRQRDRIEEIRTQFRLVDDDADKVTELRKKTQLLELGVTKPGLSDDGSLFIKVLEQHLTSEQANQYAPLRVVFRAGGLVRMWRISRPDEGLEIKLSGTAFRDDDLAHLTRLPDLKSLYLDGTRVTDAGLAHLREMTDLQFLHLANLVVTDAGLSELIDSSRLESLYLGGTHVTDAGMMHLRELTRLRTLHLRGTLVSSDGVAKLRHALPRLKIEH